MKTNKEWMEASLLEKIEYVKINIQTSTEGCRYYVDLIDRALAAADKDTTLHSGS